MNISFDFNIWSLLGFSLNFFLALYCIVAARSRATADTVEQNRRELSKAIEVSREKTEIEISRVTQRIQVVETEAKNSLSNYKEKVGLEFNGIGQRLQAVETEVKNAITHDDLSAVHKRVDEVHKLLASVGSTVSRVEGMLEGMSGRKQ